MARIENISDEDFKFEVSFDDGSGEAIHIHLTDEGIIIDVWEDDGFIPLGTSSETYTELYERLVE